MFNKSQIMKNAWAIYKKVFNSYSFAECLKIAWSNARLIIETIYKKISEKVHTWYGWKMLGKEVIHESKCLGQVTIIDPTTNKGTRVLSYFGESQVCLIGEQ